MKIIIKSIQYILIITGLSLGILFWLCMMYSCNNPTTCPTEEPHYHDEELYYKDTIK